MKALFAAGALALIAGTAQAATITFDTVEPVNGAQWTEQGFTGHVENYNDTGIGEIHGPIGAADSSASIERNAVFKAIAIDITGIGGFNIDADGEYLDKRVAYDNLVFEGYRDGVLVAFDSLFTGSVWNSFTHVFGEAFAAIDRLDISTPLDMVGLRGEGCDDCSTIQFDNFEYADTAPAPVPLPATALLLLGGIAGLGIMRRRA